MVCLCCEGSGRALATESVEQDGEDGTRALLSLWIICYTTPFFLCEVVHTR